jgi:DNA-binding NarL/FixJ family response regulator
MKHRVMIVDDQYVSRQMFELYLKDSAKYEVAYTLDSALFADTYVLKGDIDLVIMDILMEDESCGLDAAAKIKKLSPKVKIIAVTSMPEVSWLDKAKKIGMRVSGTRKLPRTPLFPSWIGQWREKVFIPTKLPW